MITQSFTISIVDDPIQAPSYGTDITPLKIEKCIIVGNGTEEGKPTVDIQLVSKNKENKYVVMVTGMLLETLAGAIIGKRVKDEAEKSGTKH